MLDAYIIDAIRQRELEREQDERRPRLEITIERPRDPEHRRRESYVPEMGDPIVIPLVEVPQIDEEAA